MNTLKAYLQSYLERKIADDAPVVQLSAISKDGNEAQGGKVLITLVHLEEETSLKAQTNYEFYLKQAGARQDPAAGKYRNPELNFNLYVLVSAHNEQYETALVYLSRVLEAFQAESSFECMYKETGENKGNKLSLSVYQMTLEQNVNLWQALGSEMMPSVMYKVKMVTIQASDSSDASLVRHIQEDYTKDFRREGKGKDERRKFSQESVETIDITPPSEE